MANINWGDISARAKASLTKGSGKKEFDKARCIAMRDKSEAVTSRFIQTLRDSINNSALSENAKDAISQFGASEPVAEANQSFSVSVYFDGDMTRPSLDPTSYPEGIDDLAALFDQGVDHTMHVVRGTWHGEDVKSRTVIKGQHFIQDAIDDFNGNYASEFDVKEIRINKI